MIKEASRFGFRTWRNDAVSKIFLVIWCQIETNLRISIYLCGKIIGSLVYFVSANTRCVKLNAINRKKSVTNHENKIYRMKIKLPKCFFF